MKPNEGLSFVGVVFDNKKGLSKRLTKPCLVLNLTAKLDRFKYGPLLQLKQCSIADDTTVSITTLNIIALSIRDLIATKHDI